MKLSKISRILESLRLKITPRNLRNFGHRPQLTNPRKHREGHLSAETIPSHECEDGVSTEELEGLPDETRLIRKYDNKASAPETFSTLDPLRILIAYGDVTIGDGES
ncbi:hypothetical protein ACEPAF_1269 [Sanghuangporus sanghuang]